MRKRSFGFWFFLFAPGLLAPGLNPGVYEMPRVETRGGLGFWVHQEKALHPIFIEHLARLEDVLVHPGLFRGIIF